MKAECDLAKMKSRQNPYASKLKNSVTMRLSDLPNVETLLVRTIWTAMLLSALWSAPSVPTPPFPGDLPISIVLMPVVFFGIMALLMPAHSPFYHPKLASWINRRCGAHAFESFLVRLKPMLLFATSTVIHSLVGISQASPQDARLALLHSDGFMLSGAAGFMLSHLVLYRRKAVGVFPTWLEQDVERPQPRQRSLRESLREFWWCLVGLAAFPVVFFVVGEHTEVPFDYFIVPFFAVGFLAAWPHFSGRAPFSYVWVMGLVWLLGGGAAVMLLSFMNHGG